jgi:folate-binding protein YgfZ
MKIPREAVSADKWRALEEGEVVVRSSGEAWFRLTGPGRVDCVQGLVTCDIAKAGDDSHSFGALLTNKGMIVSTLRVTRLAEQILISAPAAARDAVSQVLQRSLPPRLCRFEDVTGSVATIGYYGAMVPQRPTASGAPPASGRVARVAAGEQLAFVAGAVARGAPGIEVVMLPGTDGIVTGWKRPAPPGDTALEACRIFAGIPALGAEIDDKTLPQEVRFDELGAVSYTKGCYVCQETVARVHFRGHPNRRLVLLVFDEEPPDPPVELRLEEKPVGRLTSAAWSPELDAWVGQAVIRREVPDGATVHHGEVTAVVRVDRWLRAP